MSLVNYYTTLGYYAVRVGRNPGIYMSYKECEEQVLGYSGAMYRKFDTKQQAEDFIKQENFDKNILNVWTDGSCDNNFRIENKKKKFNNKLSSIAGIGVFFKNKDPRNISERLPGLLQSSNRAEVYAVIRALEICDKDQDVVINTDSTYVINNFNVKGKVNSDLVDRMNDLIRERKGKTYFKHVTSHSGIYENDQADKLAKQSLRKPFIKDFNFLSINKGKIDFYFEKHSKIDDSVNATDSYLLEFTRVLQLLEENNDKKKLLIEMRNKNIYLMLSENRIDKWLKNNWYRHGTTIKLKAPKEICIRIKNLIDSRLNEVEFVYVKKRKYNTK
ncbi:11430_t:CDS:1 [Scutellospora calospora]|uniref:11430_t:CDS:1 n=1 Tax=Scutellospora calospora TaxID=85575 RepID=A0ACA9N4M7_9GLOM|nr:11430_t:CDS:1 [Scutellospora calospora]